LEFYVKEKIMPTSEQEKADVSKARGVTAAHIQDPAEKKRFIAEQGNQEAKGRDVTPQLSQDNFNKRNQLAVLGSMKKGGTIKKTGLYKMHAGEHVIPSPEVLTGVASKDAAGKKVKVTHVKKGNKLSKKDQGKVSDAMHEVFTKTPKTVDKSKSAEGQRKQKVAIGLSKARQAGANIPEKK
jgi:Family of unknown function (DUF6496)